MDLKRIKSEYKEERQLAKSAGFAINYGGTGFTIANNANISKELGDKIYDDYFKSFSQLKSYFKKKQGEALNKGYILINEISKSKTFIPFFDDFQAAKREINNFDWEEYREEKAKQSDKFKNLLYPKVRNYFVTRGSIERDSLNYPVQGTAAEMTKLAAINLFDYIVENDLLFKVLIVNMVHDEIVLESPPELAEESQQQLKYHMEKAGNLFCKIIPIKANPEITKVWKH